MKQTIYITATLLLSAISLNSCSQKVVQNAGNNTNTTVSTSNTSQNINAAAQPIKPATTQPPQEGVTELKGNNSNIKKVTLENK